MSSVKIKYFPPSSALWRESLIESSGDLEFLLLLQTDVLFY